MDTDLQRRLPAEWEHAEAVLMAWPHAQTDWAYMLADAQDCIARIGACISHYAKLIMVAPEKQGPRAMLRLRGANMSKLIFGQTCNNDTWARDFGPICTRRADGTVIITDFQFNGWGLKFAADHDNLITRNLWRMGILNAPGTEYANELSFVLEGGSIDIDTDGTLLTTCSCLLSPNRNGSHTREDIERKLAETLGATRQIWLKHGWLAGDDTDSHVDTLARFLPGGIIAYTACDREDDEHFADLKLMEAELREATNTKELPYSLLPLCIPPAIVDDEGNRLPATYANFLLLNGALLVPTYGCPEYDQRAIAALAEALPDYEIVPIDCSALIREHGSLHCATMQLPARLGEFVD